MNLEKLELSKYVKLFDNENFTCLFHSISMVKVYGSKVLLDIYESLIEPVEYRIIVEKFPEKIIKQLIQNKFIVSNDSKNDDDELNNIKESVGKINVRNLVLLISNDCNFKCSYCQIEENMHEDSMVNMSVKVADKALNLFKENSLSSTSKTITITGGEPLLNIDVVKFIIEKAKKDFENTRVVIFTNGSLITNELAQYFKKNNVLTLVSLDGPEEMHNKVRKFRNDKGTFESTLQGYRKLKESGCNVGVSAVGGSHNVKELKKTFDFFVNLEPPSIGFNFSHFLLDKENPTEISISEFGDILIKFYQVLREEGIYLENISRSINSFSSNTPRIRECQAHGFGFTVDARGKIGPCKSLLVSDIFSQDIDNVSQIENNEMFQDWATRSPYLQDECIYCPAISLCGGGCAYDSYIVNNGDYKKVDKRICSYQKKVLDYLISDLFEKIKGNLEQEDIYIPTIEDQVKAFSSYFDINNSLQRSVGHEVEKS